MEPSSFGSSGPKAFDDDFLNGLWGGPPSPPASKRVKVEPASPVDLEIKGIFDKAMKESQSAGIIEAADGSGAQHKYVYIKDPDSIEMYIGKISEKIGEGATTSYFKIECLRRLTNINNDLVLKVPHEDTMDLELAQQEIDDEADFLRCNAHEAFARPPIVQLNTTALGSELQTVYITERIKCDLANKETASANITSELTQVALIDKFSTLADGLVHLHNMNKAHGDLDPSNIVLTQSSKLRIIDWGSVIDLKPIDEDEIDIQCFGKHKADYTPVWMKDQEGALTVEDRKFHDVFGLALTFIEIVLGEKYEEIMEFDEDDYCMGFATGVNKEALEREFTEKGFPKDLGADLFDLIVRGMQKGTHAGKDEEGTTGGLPSAADLFKIFNNMRS